MDIWQKDELRGLLWTEKHSVIAEFSRRAAKRGFSLHPEILRLLASAFLVGDDQPEVQSCYQAYDFELSLQQLPVYRAVRQRRVFRVPKSASARRVKKAARNNARTLVDAMIEIHIAARSYAKNFSNPKEEIKPAALATALAWLCPIWPFC
jgi:hypothetical protein